MSRFIQPLLQLYGQSSPKSIIDWLHIHTRDRHTAKVLAKLPNVTRLRLLDKCMKKILDLRKKSIVPSLILHIGTMPWVGAVAADLKSSSKDVKMALVCIGNSAEDFLWHCTFRRHE